MKKLLTCLLFTSIWMSSVMAQTTEELIATQAAKQAELDTLQPQLKALTAKVETLTTEIAALKDQIAPYPRWDIGAQGNTGFDFAGFNDWLSKSSPNTTSFNINFAGTGQVNLDQKKYFWRNRAGLTIGWNKFDDRDDPTDDSAFKVTSDALDASSLYGHKLSEHFALSALGEYRTSVLENTFNNPGFLDLGAGVTWTPIKDLVVVVHPLNYNFIFSKGPFEYQESWGAKLYADYTLQITKHLSWKSNASGFLSYKDIDLSNWTWTNSFSTAIKGIGLGFDFGLRGNKQEALAAGRTVNPLQSYFIVGLSFKF